MVTYFTVMDSFSAALLIPPFHYSSARKLWRDYFASGVDGVVFIVDAVDKERFPEAKRELDVRNFEILNIVDLLFT